MNILFEPVRDIGGKADLVVAVMHFRFSNHLKRGFLSDSSWNESGFHRFNLKQRNLRGVAGKKLGEKLLNNAKEFISDADMCHQASHNFIFEKVKMKKVDD